MKNALFPITREEGLRNLAFPSPAGNRLECATHAEELRLRLFYNPHAGRRRDAASRAFSTRDIHTDAFAAMRIAELPDAAIAGISYDPFITGFQIQHASSARNTLRLLTFAEENAYALTATEGCALLLKPHTRFQIEESWLVEEFEDRGERLCSFTFFSGMLRNRVRELDDGWVAIQFFGREAIVFGAEENRAQMRRLHRKLARRTFDDLLVENEAVLAPLLAEGRPHLADTGVQRIADLNRRIILAGIDLGGGSYGGFNREYDLTWQRDGGLTSAEMAASGMSAPIRRWAPFSIANPAPFEMPDGTEHPLYSQLVGTRWCKRQEDGFYAATLSAFAHWRTTGRLPRHDTLDLLDAGLQTLLELTYTPPEDDSAETSAAGLFSSNHRCERLVASASGIGTDPVNGHVLGKSGAAEVDGTPVARLWSLYINILNWQALKMLSALATLSGDPRATRFTSLTETVEHTLLTRFRQPDGSWLAELAEYPDGSRRWIPLEHGDEWEMNWALVMPPFTLDPATTAPFAVRVAEHFAEIKKFSHSPMALHAAFGAEYGNANQAAQTLAYLTEDARTPEDFAPYAGAISERSGVTVGAWPNWRPILFVVAPYLRAINAHALAPLPFGLAARSGHGIQAIDGVVFQNMSIDVRCEGEGDAVDSLTLNGCAVRGTLQLPSALLRPGERNLLHIVRGTSRTSRLYRSDGILREIRETADETLLILHFPIAGDLIWQGTPACTGHTFTPIPGSPGLFLTRLAAGDHILKIPSH